MNVIKKNSTSTCFSCRRLNSTTFLIVEDDKLGEKPFIYVKLYEQLKLVVISDTGVGGNTSPDSMETVRSFIETCPIPDNNHEPLNPRLDSGEPRSKYLIILTHCHYDHILGIPSFDDVSPVIVASGNDKLFIEENLPEHSLCKAMNLETPDYKVTYWAEDMKDLFFEIKQIGLQILHTPGHTPDELAWYDAEARHIFVGDSFYKRLAEEGSYEQAIIFPIHGNLVHFMRSLEKIQSFVKDKNSEQGKPALKLGCGHTTSSVDAESIMPLVTKYFWDVIGGSIPVKKSFKHFGIVNELYKEDGSPQFSLQIPRILVSRAREHFRIELSAA